jgi:hypothetical protein
MTVLKRKIGELFASGGSADVFMTIKKVYKRLSKCMLTFLAASLEKLITRDPRAGPWGPWCRSWAFSGQLWGKTVQENLRYTSNVRRRGQLSVRALTGKAEDAGLAQEESLGCVGEEGLASQLTWQQPFGLFCVRRLWVIG